MDVCIWGGDSTFGLAALEPSALQLFTHFKFAGPSNTEIIQKKNTIFSPIGNFPTFCHRGKELDNLEDVVKHLEKEDVNSHLNHAQKCELYIFEKYIKVTLDPCLKYAWWIDEKNFNEHIRPWFARNIGIPFNFYYPGQYQKKAVEYIDSLYDETCGKNEIYHAIYNSADVCFNNLSTKLEDNPYFFGKKPCSLDAVIFSYLAPILRVTLKDQKITNLLKKYDNLIKFVDRISAVYFEKIDREYRELRRSQAILNAENKKTEAEYVHHTIFAVIIAAVAMLGYAQSHGLLARMLSDPNSDYNELFDGDDDDN